MDLQDVQELTNFLERRVSAYQVSIAGEVCFSELLRHFARETRENRKRFCPRITRIDANRIYFLIRFFSRNSRANLNHERTNY